MTCGFFTTEGERLQGSCALVVLRHRRRLEIPPRRGAERAPERRHEGARALVADRVGDLGDAPPLGQALQGEEEAGPLPPDTERQSRLAAEQPLQRPRA